MSHYLFGDPAEPVRSAVRGLGRLYPETLVVSEDPLFVWTDRANAGRRVGLVSGGGSGHEPLHAGFVGPAGLDAAVPGQVFASPHNRQVYEASKRVTKPGGVLHIVKNYTGDLINFGIAAERLAAEGIEVGRVVVADDLATGGDEVETGRRGTAATVIIEKILGAAADEGLSLDELVALGDRVVARSRSIALATRAHTLVATGQPAFELEPGHVDYGIGIHGERARQSRELGDVAATVSRMVDETLAEIGETPEGVVVVVNGMGATTLLELYGLYDLVTDRLRARDVTVEGAMVGTLVSALNMRGFSVSVTALEPGWARWFRASTGTPALPPVEDAAEGGRRAAATADAAPAAPAPAGAIPRDGILEALSARAHGLHDALTRLDQAAGDGDFGDNFVGGLTRARARVRRGGDAAGLTAAATAFLDDVGGTSGPLYGLLFQELAAHLAEAEDGSATEAVGRGLAGALRAIQRVGGAELGDRTMVDALAPAAAVPSGASLIEATAAAAEGARSTATLTARRGRASYVGDHALGSPDPGAVGIVLVLAAITTVLEPQNREKADEIVEELIGR